MVGGLVAVTGSHDHFVDIVEICIVGMLVIGMKLELQQAYAGIDLLARVKAYLYRARGVDFKKIAIRSTGNGIAYRMFFGIIGGNRGSYGRAVVLGLGNRHRCSGLVGSESGRTSTLGNHA